MSSNPKSSARLAAIQGYYSLMIDQNQKTSNVLDSVFSELNNNEIKIKKKFAEELLNFCLHEKDGISSIIKKYSDKNSDIEKVNPLLLAIVSTGIAEIITDTTTDRPIIISEYMNIATEFFGKAEAGFVNAVLDKYIKDNK